MGMKGQRWLGGRGRSPDCRSLLCYIYDIKASGKCSSLQGALRPYLAHTLPTVLSCGAKTTFDDRSVRHRYLISSPYQSAGTIHDMNWKKNVSDLAVRTLAPCARYNVGKQRHRHRRGLALCFVTVYVPRAWRTLNSATSTALYPCQCGVVPYSHRHRHFYGFCRSSSQRFSN